MTNKQERITQLRKALRTIKSLDARIIRQHSDEMGRNGINIWPNGSITDGSTMYATSVFVSSMNCRTKRDALASIRDELVFTRKSEDVE